MKKILFIILYSSTSYLLSHEESFSCLIRSSDLIQFSEILKLKSLSEKERIAYIDLSEEIIIFRRNQMHINDPSRSEYIYNAGAMFGFAFSSAALMYSDLKHKDLIALGMLGYFGTALLIKKSVAITQERYVEKEQLYKNAQEIKQLILMN